MNPSRPLLEVIAREHLCIPTLDGQGSDRLDFHDVSVWQVEAALAAAYEAGYVAGMTKVMTTFAKAGEP